MKLDLKEYVRELLSEALANNNKRQKVASVDSDSIDSDSDDSGTSPVCEVEEIMGTKIINGTKYFEVKWTAEGFKWGNSWEPRSNLSHARELLAAFEAGEELKTVEIREGVGHRADVMRLLNRWVLKQAVQSLVNRTTDDVWAQFVKEMGKGKVRMKFETDLFRRALREKKAKDPDFSLYETPFKPRNGMLLLVAEADQDEVEGAESSSISEEEQTCVSVLQAMPKVNWAECMF